MPGGEQGLSWLLDIAATIVPGAAPPFLDPVCCVLSAESGKLFVA